MTSWILLGVRTGEHPFFRSAARTLPCFLTWTRGIHHGLWIDRHSGGYVWDWRFDSFALAGALFRTRRWSQGGQMSLKSQRFKRPLVVLYLYVLTSTIWNQMNFRGFQHLVKAVLQESLFIGLYFFCKMSPIAPCHFLKPKNAEDGCTVRYGLPSPCQPCAAWLHRAGLGVWEAN